MRGRRGGGLCDWVGGCSVTMVIGSFEGPSRAGGHLEMTTSGRGVGDNRGGG